METFKYSGVELHSIVRFETDDRIRNYKSTIGWLVNHFPANKIYVHEYDIYPRLPADQQIPVVNHVFHKTDTIFHKTAYLRDIALSSRAEVLIGVDIDCVLESPQSIQSAIEMCRNGYSMVNPFDLCGNYNLLFPCPEFERTHDIKHLKALMAGGSLNFYNSPTTPVYGGWWVLNRNDYISAGMHNPNFVNYGPDDVELPYRMEKLGYKLGRVPGIMFHQWHARTPISTNAHEFHAKNTDEWSKIKSLTSDQLKEYVTTWPKDK